MRRRTIHDVASQRAQLATSAAAIDMENRIANLERQGPGCLITWVAMECPTIVGPHGFTWSIPKVLGQDVLVVLSRALFRIEAATDSGTFEVDIESSPTGAFSATTLATLTITSGNVLDEVLVTGTLDATDQVRINFASIGVVDPDTPYHVELEGRVYF